MRFGLGPERFGVKIIKGTEKREAHVTRGGKRLRKHVLVYDASSINPTVLFYRRTSSDMEQLPGMYVEGDVTRSSKQSLQRAGRRVRRGRDGFYLQDSLADRV